VKVILDTNVFISGVFFSGPPYEILNAWRHGKIQLVVSSEILDEYRRAGERLASSYPGVDISPFLKLIAVHGNLVSASVLSERICDDLSDDKFFACAIGSGCNTIISGDKHLHKASGYKGIEVYRPSVFTKRFLIS
jgi:putative PIN family toxin of toxin-antitoxin system